MLPGMYVQVSILLRRIESTLLLPIEAFCERDSGSGVFIIKDDIVTFIKPELGIRSGNFIAVLSGLSKGDKLVTTGNHLVTDNSHVNVVTTDGKAQASTSAKKSDTSLEQTNSGVGK